MVEINDERLDANLVSTTTVLMWDIYISKFLSIQKLPKHLDANEQWKIMLDSQHYAIIAHLLYQQEIDSVLCKCVSKPEAIKILEVSHDGICGGHFMICVLALKIP